MTAKFLSIFPQNPYTIFRTCDDICFCLTLHKSRNIAYSELLISRKYEPEAQVRKRQKAAL